MTYTYLHVRINVSKLRQHNPQTDEFTCSSDITYYHIMQEYAASDISQTEAIGNRLSTEAIKIYK